MEQDEFEEQFCEQFIEIKGLMPANNIYIKPTAYEEPKAILKMQVAKNEIIYADPPKRFALKRQQQQEEDDYQQQYIELTSPLSRYLYGLKCMYMKFKNINHNKLQRTQYFSGLFVDKRQFKGNKSQITNIKQFFSHLLGQQICIQQDLSQKPNDVRFDSYFQSGNLFAAYKRSEKQYDLVLQNDINSKGNTQWFYFSVSNLPTNIDITFNIINLMKSDSLFNYGMQPTVFSKLGNKKNGQGWYRTGKDISYYRNNIKKEKSKRYFYTLTFKIRPQFQGDTIFISHCFPYSYSSLKEYMDSLLKSPYRKNFVQRNTIGKTVGNQNIQVLTIAQPLPSIKDPRKIILFMARQHPGQTQSSFVCQGVINYLVSNSKQAQFLRSKYIIKIIPMINPDGVIFGNYRTNLAGFDLNRKWDGADNYQIFPEILAIKTFIADLHKQKKVRFIIDLHGHSKKLNSFFYGNPNQNSPQLVRMLPFICSKINPQISFEDCTFFIEQGKKKTARVYLSLTHQISCIYTYEVSFFGYSKEGKKFPFGIEQFRGLGTTLCQTLHSILENEFLSQRKQNTSNSAITKYISQLKSNNALIELGNRGSSGSDSQPQMFQLLENQDSQIQQKTDELKKQRMQQKQRQKSYRLNFQKTQMVDPSFTLNTTPQTSNSNVLPTRATVRSLKQPPNKKKMVMSLSKVNSIVPDKYQMSLQPASIRKKQPSPFRVGKTTRPKATNFQSTTQTIKLEEKDWMIMRRLEVDKNNNNNTYYKNWRAKQTKYIPVSTATKIRKNMVLKVDYSPNSLLSLTSFNRPFLKMKQQSCQTNLTSFPEEKIAPSFDNKIRTMTYFSNQEMQTTRIQPVPIIRALKIHSLRQDSNVLFDDMLKRYLIDADRFKTKISPVDCNIFLQKQRFSNSIQKSLTIKKKQIAPQSKSLKKSQ